MSVIEPLNLPKANLKLKRRDGETFVWCVIRKKELLCTPEEWVRQHILHYLINEKKIPIGLIASEMSLEYNGLQKRADVVVFDRNQQPLLIVECKATNVPITEKVLQQIAQYNFSLDVKFLMLTNGNEHVYCEIDNQKLKYLKDLPEDIV